jgi:hypothetical protein
VLRKSVKCTFEYWQGISTVVDARTQTERLGCLKTAGLAKTDTEHELHWRREATVSIVDFLLLLKIDATQPKK